MARCVRRLLSLACALALAILLMSPPARGVLSGVYLTAVNDELMELEAETMPFWSGNHLYVSSAVFSGTYATTLGVAFSPGINNNLTVLYSIRSTRTALFFDLTERRTYDNRGNDYSQLAVQRNGQMFFPLDLVTDFFGLTYTYTYTDPVPLIRVKSDTVILSDAAFIDAATDAMNRFYSAYERAMTPQEPTEPDDPSPPVVYTGHWVYPVFTVTDGEDTRALLATLSQWDGRAAFLFSLEQLQADGDLVRMVVGQGHAVGLLPSGTTAQEVAEELEAANDALWQAARLRTRLVWLEDAQGGALSAVRNGGYCLMETRLDYRRAPLTSSARADAVFSYLNGLATRQLTIFFGEDSGNVRGLGRLLSQLEEAQCRVLAYRETLG